MRPSRDESSGVDDARRAETLRVRRGPATAGRRESSRRLRSGQAAWLPLCELGGGGSAAIANACAAIHGGLADVVVVYRALAQGQFGRFGQGPRSNSVSGDMAHTLPYGLMSPAQMFAMKVVRFMHDYELKQETLRAISMASYYHAQNNPRAVMHGRPLTEEQYENSRWIVEPFHLFDCCQENDGAAAMVLVSADRAKDLREKPAYVMGAMGGSHYRAGAAVHNTPDYDLHF